MGYRSQSGSHRGGQRFQRGPLEKKKSKSHKAHAKSKMLLEEKNLASAGEVTEKTLRSLKRLGEQKFAVSPFSQYFDVWLINLRDVLCEFESNPDVRVDDAFTKEQEGVTAKIEQEFEMIKQNEAVLNLAVRELAEKNHLLVELDTDYAAKTREIGPMNNAEIQQLTHSVHCLEEERELIKATKTSFFGFTKKAKAKKESELKVKLDAAKEAVESAIKKFKVEQEKLHDEYQKMKQAAILDVQKLEKEVEKLEIDKSTEVRREACEELSTAINALFHRRPVL